MITDQDRSGWIGASDVMYVIGNWRTKTWEKWWMTKLGIFRGKFENEYTLAGTNWEHKILDSLHIPDLEKDKQILMPEILLRVNLDGNTPYRIKECKTYKADGKSQDAMLLKSGQVPTKYRNQIQVQMFASGIHEGDIVAYGLQDEDYKNYLRPVDPQRVQQIPVAYDQQWIELTYQPKHRVLADCLKRRMFPNV